MGVSLPEHRKEYACVWWKACRTPTLGLGPSSTKRLHTCTRGGDMTSIREAVCFRYQGWCSLYDAAAEPSPPCGFKKIVLNLQSDGCVGPRRGRQAWTKGRGYRSAVYHNGRCRGHCQASRIAKGRNRYKEKKNYDKEQEVTPRVSRGPGTAHTTSSVPKPNDWMEAFPASLPAAGLMLKASPTIPLAPPMLT
jgi:hypothetical protein